MTTEKKRRSNKQEKRVAELLGTRLQPGSGCVATLSLRNDSKSEDLLVENKYTDNKRQYTLRFADLQALVQRAYTQGLEPVLQLDLNNLSPTKEFVVIPLDFFVELVKTWQTSRI